MAVKKDIEIAQGHTYSAVLRWEIEAPIVRLPISMIACPTGAARITVPSTASLPDGWRVAITGVQGMKKINDPNTYYTATVLDATTIELNDLDISDYPPYTMDGFVSYNTPVDLTGMTFRFRMKTKQGGTVLASNDVADTPLDILTLTADTTLKTILYTFPSTATTALAGKSGWYDIEAVSSDSPPVVTQLAFGTVKVGRE